MALLNQSGDNNMMTTVQIGLFSDLTFEQNRTETVIVLQLKVSAVIYHLMVSQWVITI
jgi:hypothetical protein